MKITQKEWMKNGQREKRNLKLRNLKLRNINHPNQSNDIADGTIHNNIHLMGVNVRCAVPSDLTAVRKIDHESFGERSYPLFVLRQYLDCFGSLFRVAVVNNEIIGFIIGGIEFDKSIGWGLALIVSKPYRNSGIGALLIKELLVEFRLKRIKKIKCLVDPQNLGAIKLYQKLGFARRETIIDYYNRNENEQRILMMIDIL
ncbi:MAG: N-acetyltransferase [Bacteroidia bacterium]